LLLVLLDNATATKDPGPRRLTPEGAELLCRLTETVAPTTGQTFAGMDREDLATAYRVLRRIIDDAAQVRD
jgi:hypothetical protein